MAADAADRFSLNGLRNGEVTASSCIAADLNGSVRECRVHIGRAFIFTDPTGVQCYILRKDVRIVLAFIGLLRVVKPAVKDDIVPLGFRHSLERAAPDKDLRFVLKLFRQHVIGQRPFFHTDERIDIQKTEAVLPVLSQRSQVNG